jgi:ferredoxin
VFQQLRRAQVPIASSCLGEAVCGRCVVEVVEGEVTPTTPDERVRLEILGLTGVRLACRLRARGPGVVLRTTYW